MKFRDVLAREVGDIAARRAWVRREKADWIGAHPGFAPPELDAAAELEKQRRGQPLDVLGLALSGGGVRSAAFCLGVLQALDVSLRKRTGDNTAPSPLLRVDYLSTVSGGGYIGTSMTAAMSVNDGKFPFESKLDENETPSLQHVRNYSNYLFPRGPGDLLRNALIYLRGLAANIVLVVPWLFLAAAITIFFNPTVAWLDRPVLAAGLRENFGPTHFFFTTWLGIAGFVLLLLWGLWRSLPAEVAEPELPSAFLKYIGYLLLALFVIAFIELQPLVIERLVQDAHEHDDVARFPAVPIINWIIVFFTPVAAAVSFLWGKLQAVVEGAKQSPSFKRIVMAALSLVAIYAGAAAVPFVLWAIYLKLSYWVIADATLPGSLPAWLVALAQWRILTFPADWLAGLFTWLAPLGDTARETIVSTFKFASVYGFTWFLFFAVGWLFDPNANSLHRLYRDRLSKAFLFKIRTELATPDDAIPRLGTLQANVGDDEMANARAATIDPKANMVTRAFQRFRWAFTPSAGLKMSELSNTFCPYHIINTPLNLQASRAANRRGRNADFFIFSRNAVGSEVTDYVTARQFEEYGSSELTLDTAMAISGAAFNANMGSLTIKPLSPTLAFFNVRLGYWLRNPRYALPVSWLKRTICRFFNPYFLHEALGRLNEKRWNVYVSDGGHLENLGLYQLLKRRCKVIIAVDAEADETIRMASFITLQRYARIDLGVRIELPWQRIQTASKDVNTIYRETGGPGGKLDCRGPHCAVGVIHYGDEKGVLVYVKASLTGDENDYVADYKRRYDQFPHETTLDQFFSEEQFEVYRALGFHALDRLLDGTDEVAVYSQGSAVGTPKKFSAADPLLDKVRQALGFA